MMAPDDATIHILIMGDLLAALAQTTSGPTFHKTCYYSVQIDHLDLLY